MSLRFLISRVAILILAIWSIVHFWPKKASPQEVLEVAPGVTISIPPSWQKSYVNVAPASGAQKTGSTKLLDLEHGDASLSILQQVPQDSGSITSPAGVRSRAELLAAARGLSEISVYSTLSGSTSRSLVVGTQKGKTYRFLFSTVSDSSKAMCLIALVRDDDTESIAALQQAMQDSRIGAVPGSSVFLWERDSPAEGSGTPLPASALLEGSASAAPVATGSPPPAAANPSTVNVSASAETGGTAGSSSAVDLTSRAVKSLVIVKGNNGAGSAFLCKSGSGSVLLTNAHVMANVEQPKFVQFSGKLLEPKVLACAPDRDVFRIECRDTPESTLEVIRSVDQEVRVTDRVVVLGNSDGAGVMKMIEGSVTGIGPDLIEIDAPFVAGNSGSPIIHQASGKVIGIATYILKKKVPKEGMADGETTERRFGFRLDNIGAWESVRWNSFQAQATQLQSIEQRSRAFIELFRDATQEKLGASSYSDGDVRRCVTAYLQRVLSPSQKRLALSSSDFLTAKRQFVGDLRALSKSDIIAFDRAPSYGHFRKAVADETLFRDELYNEFTKTIDRLSR